MSSCVIMSSWHHLIICHASYFDAIQVSMSSCVMSSCNHVIMLSCDHFIMSSCVMPVIVVVMWFRSTDARSGGEQWGKCSQRRAAGKGSIFCTKKLAFFLSRKYFTLSCKILILGLQEVSCPSLQSGALWSRSEDRQGDRRQDRRQVMSGDDCSGQGLSSEGAVWSCQDGWLSGWSSWEVSRCDEDCLRPAHKDQ